MLTDDQTLDMAQFGRTWHAFRRMSQSEIEERKRPVNLLSNRRTLKHCIKVLGRLQEHNRKAYSNGPHLHQLKWDMWVALGTADELIDTILWQ